MLSPTCSFNNFPEHGSMASDNCLPDAVSGGNEVDPVAEDSSTVYLFDAFVEVLCGFGL